MAIEFPSKDEIEVAGILLHLPELILTRELQSPVFFTWGTRKRRSDPSNRENDNIDDAVVVSQPPPPPPPQKSLEVKAGASSPATPLSFSPSESESMSHRSKRRSHHHHDKRKREEWLEHITELTQQKAQLLCEIQEVRSYYDKLNDFNLLLKARKEEELINKVIKKATPDLKTGQSSSLVCQFNNQELRHHNHNKPSFKDRTVQIRSRDYSESPLGIPDLNVSIEESFEVDAYQPLDLTMIDRDLSRAKASEARQRRIQINKNKNSIAANKQRNPYG